MPSPINITPVGAVSLAEFGLGLLSSFGAKVDIVGVYANGPSTAGAVPTTQSNLGSFLSSSSIVQSLTGNTATQAAFGQMFANARPMKATLFEDSQTMRHPIETGALIPDHKIINPVAIEIPFVVTAQYYASMYAQMRQAWINSTAVSIKTRTGVYSNMYIAKMPHVEDAEMFSAIVITVRFEEAQRYTQGSNTLQSNYSPANAANSNTISSGLQQGVALAGQLLTGATAAASYVNLAKRL